MLTRRDLFKKTLDGAALVALSPTVPTFLARTARAAEPRRDGRVLVVIQLDGGNDAINTLVPFRDEGYAKHRSALRLDQKSLIKVNGEVGLHPALRDMGKLLEGGQLALVPGVGYPNPNRSHFESMAIWQSARLDPEEHAGPGWIGRGLDAQSKRARPSTGGRIGPVHRRRHAAGRPACPTGGDVISGSARRPRAPRGMVAIAGQPVRPGRRAEAMTSTTTSAGARSTPTPPRGAWPS